MNKCNLAIRGILNQMMIFISRKYQKLSKIIGRVILSEFRPWAVGCNFRFRAMQVAFQSAPYLSIRCFLLTVQLQLAFELQIYHSWWSWRLAYHPQWNLLLNGNWLMVARLSFQRWTDALAYALCAQSLCFNLWLSHERQTLSLCSCCMKQPWSWQ